MQQFANFWRLRITTAVLTFAVAVGVCLWQPLPVAAQTPSVTVSNSGGITFTATNVGSGAKVGLLASGPAGTTSDSRIIVFRCLSTIDTTNPPSCALQTGTNTTLLTVPVNRGPAVAIVPTAAIQRGFFFYNGTGWGPLTATVTVY